MKIDTSAMIGKKYNHLTVVEVDAERSQQRKHTYYRCKCDCGRVTSTARRDILSGQAASCGHSIHRSDVTQKRLIGQRAGVYDVLEQSQTRRGFYLCRCTRCGFVREVHKTQLSDYLRGEPCQGCSNCVYDVGFTQGRLTIISRDAANSTVTCRCSCGTEITYGLQRFKDARPKTCGH